MKGELIWSWSINNHIKLQPLPKWVEWVVSLFILVFVIFVIVNIKPTSMSWLEVFMILIACAVVLRIFFYLDEKKNKTFHTGEINIYSNGIAYDLIDEFKHGYFYKFSDIKRDTMRIERKYCKIAGKGRTSYALVFDNHQDSSKEAVLPLPHIESDGDTLKQLMNTVQELKSKTT